MLDYLTITLAFALACSAVLVFIRMSDCRANRPGIPGWPSVAIPGVLLKSRFSSKLIVHRFEAIAQTPEHLQ